MTRIEIVLGIVASVAAIFPITSGISGKWNEAAIDLYSKNENRWVGAIKLHQPERSNDDQDIGISGLMWGLPAGKYFAVLHERPTHKVNGSCDSAGPMIHTYDDHLKEERPLVLFWDDLEKDNYHKLGNSVGKLSLNPKDKNYIRNFVVLVYTASWDKSGPLNSFFQPGASSAVACGLSYHGN